MMNLDDFKSVWQNEQQQATGVDVESISQRVRRRSTTFSRKVLIRDIVELAAAAIVIPVFVLYFRMFDSWVAKAGAAMVVIAATQVVIVLLSTRFRRRQRSDVSLIDFTKEELRRVDEQNWLLKHVAAWYVGPIMVGCFVFSCGVVSGWALLAQAIFLALFAVFLIVINQLSARWKIAPLRKELVNTLRSLDAEIEITEPQFLGFEKMRTYNLSAMAAALFACVLGSATSLLPAGELSVDEAKKFASASVESERVDGISVGIIDGARQMTFHFGEAKGGALPNDQTLYEIGSITKVFTGILLADAAKDENRLLESSPPAVDGVALPEFDGTKITWKQLATHQSGLPRLPSNMGTDLKNPYANYDSKLAKDFLRTHRLKSRPGAKSEYSNFGASWLGHLVSTRAGMGYEQLLAQQITKPLGMSDTVISLSDDQQKRFATPHSSFGNECSSWEFADLPGAGGIRSTVTDMMKFMKAQLDVPEGDIGESIELAWQEHKASKGGSFAMGLGWHIARDGETRWHNGQTGGFHSAMFVNRRLDIGVVVLANTASDEIDRIAELLVQRLAGARVEPPKVVKEIKVDAATMKRLEGRYQLAPTFIFDVKVKDGNLMVGVTNQPTHQVYARAKNRWFYKVVDAELEFDLGATGSAKSVVLHQNGIRQKARRIKK